MDEENNNNGFFKEQAYKAKEKLKDEGKKQAKKKLVQLIASHPMGALIVLGVIVAVIILVILFAGFEDIIIFDWAQDASNAKKEAINLSLTSDATDNENTKITVSKTDDGNYNISNNYTEEELNNIKEEINQTTIDSSKFTDFEIGIIGALLDNGVDIDDYEEDELKCLPAFIKAEACTQYLDLRKNSEKFDTSGNYKPEQLNNLKENEVPGIILVQRTNTNSNNPTTLEYKKKDEFDQLVTNNNKDVINYFTINEKANLVIAKWDHTVVKVNGNYPENLSEEEKVQARDDMIITTTEIPYMQYVTKYTLPFDFLMQLLAITEDTNFCREVADIVLGSKIIINIQEEETITTTTEVRTYDVHSKEEKIIDYNIEPNLESQKDYLIEKVQDDEGNKCTTYNNKTDIVTITTTNTSHTYNFEILESDTWIAHYKKTYQKQQPEIQPAVNNSVDSIGEYQQGEETTIIDTNEIQKDKDVSEFKKNKEKEYKDKVPVPNVKVSTHTKGLFSDRTYKEISITPKGKFSDNLSSYEFDQKEIMGEGGNITYGYEMPTSFTVTTKRTSELPFEVNFDYRLNNNYTYSLNNTNKDDVLKCNISKLLIRPYNKINLNNNITTTITKYPSDPNPTTNTHIYAKDENGNFEKFLVAYNNNKDARDMINSIDLWLFEMMEENESTINLLDIVKYLLYMYDGTDYGVTELDLSLFNPDGFSTLNIGNGTGFWWPIGSETTEDINGKTFAKGEPALGKNNISRAGRVGSKYNGYYGIHEKKNGSAVDIAGNGQTNKWNVISIGNGVVKRVGNGIPDGQKEPSEGNYVVIDYGDGIEAYYYHLYINSIIVNVGDTVEYGQVVGKMGHSGNSTGVHLHIEIKKNGEIVDTTEYINPEEPRPTSSSSSLRDWIWGIEGGNKYINGNIWTVFDPAGTSDNTMNLAHGMVIASYDGGPSWYPDIIPGTIHVGQTVTEEQANQVWERKIKGFSDAIDSACMRYNVTLTSNQRDALISCIYRLGYGNGQNNKLVEAYKNGGNAGLWNYMKETYNHSREYEVGTKARLAEEYELFVKGDYNYNPNGTVKYNQYCTNPNI